jgi:hypothetical protein
VSRRRFLITTRLPDARPVGPCHPRRRATLLRALRMMERTGGVVMFTANPPDNAAQVDRGGAWVLLGCTLQESTTGRHVSSGLPASTVRRTIPNMSRADENS